MVSKSGTWLTQGDGVFIRRRGGTAPQVQCATRVILKTNELLMLRTASQPLRMASGESGERETIGNWQQKEHELAQAKELSQMKENVSQETT